MDNYEHTKHEPSSISGLCLLKLLCLEIKLVASEILISVILKLNTNFLAI